MTRLKLFSAAAALAAVTSLALPGTSFAQGYYQGYDQGYGPCTPPADQAVGAAGPALSGGQLMAGVGQCRRIADGHPVYHGRAYWHRSNAGPGWGSYPPGY